MVADGLLEPSALDHFELPLWFPTVDEVVAPVSEESDLKAAFQIVDASVTAAPVHPNDVYEDSIGEPAACARLYAGCIRGFGESSLKLHLFGRSARDGARVDDRVEEFFGRLTRYYETGLARHASETMIATLVLRRR